MARYRTQGRVRRQIQELFKGDAGGIASVLSAQQVQRAVQALGIRFRDCLFTPWITLWTFLAQVLSADGSCRDAVAKLMAFVTASGAQEVQPDTGPYCKARQRLPEKLISQLARDAGQQLHRSHSAEGKASAAGKLLNGRTIKVVDGTTCSMPDTPANQRDYPQPAPQKPGLGFPMARLVAILSLNCAAVLAVAIGPYAGKESGELALFRTLWDDDAAALEADDVLLADRYYASYWNIASLSRRGVDGLFRQHQRRKIDFRAGHRLGEHDHLIVLRRPVQPPDWMDRRTFNQMPETLTVREVRVVVAQRGFRVRKLVLVTTLLDAQLYNKQELALAFRYRWNVELDLRSIKQTMNMSVLRCKTPEMVRKEIWMHLLAYNLVRTVMAEAAERAGIEPREVSFAGAVQAINAWVPFLMMADAGDRQALMDVLLKAIARHRVGDRPDRYEPRAVKRRAKPIALLTVTREEARKRLEKRGTTKGSTTKG
jgi:Transposase DDE domain